jgi:hypothetical protein
MIAVAEVRHLRLSYPDDGPGSAESCKPDRKRRTGNGFLDPGALGGLFAPMHQDHDTSLA